MLGRHSCVVRATAICNLHIVESFRTINWYSTSFPRNQKQQCRNRPQKCRTDIPSINPPRKLMSRLAISSASFQYFFLNLPLARANRLGRSMKNTTSCKKATELPGKTSLLIGQKNIFLPNQRDGIRPPLELVW